MSDELDYYREIARGNFKPLDDISFLDSVMDMAIIDGMLKDFDEWLASPLYDLDDSCFNSLFLEEGQEDN